MSWLSKLGLVSVDLSVLLDRQLELTSQGLHQLEAWCRNPSQELMDDVFRLETEGDGARAAVATGLAAAFETPLDREYLNDLSRHIDDLLDEARAMVRLGTALKVAPEANVCDMSTREWSICAKPFSACPGKPKWPTNSPVRRAAPCG